MAPLVLSLVLAAFFKRARLNGFVELDKLRRQLCTAQAVALAGKIDLRTLTGGIDCNSRCHLGGCNPGERRVVSGNEMF